VRACAGGGEGQGASSWLSVLVAGLLLSSLARFNALYLVAHLVAFTTQVPDDQPYLPRYLPTHRSIHETASPPCIDAWFASARPRLQRCTTSVFEYSDDGQTLTGQTRTAAATTGDGGDQQEWLEAPTVAAGAAGGGADGSAQVGSAAWLINNLRWRWHWSSVLSLLESTGPKPHQDYSHHRPKQLQKSSKSQKFGTPVVPTRALRSRWRPLWLQGRMWCWRLGRCCRELVLVGACGFGCA